MTIFLRQTLMPFGNSEAESLQDCKTTGVPVFRCTFPLRNFRRTLRLICSFALGTLLQASAANPIVAAIPSAPEISADAANQASDYTPEEDASYERGGVAYFQLCHACHGPDGTGAPILDDPDERRLAPSLSRSWRVTGRPEYTITALLYGVTGPVDGADYTGQMVSMSSYGDAWIADVASYIRNSFDNAAPMVTSNQVARIRKRIGDRAEPFTVAEILSTLPVALTNHAAWKATASHNSAAAAQAIHGASQSKAAAWTAGIPQDAGTWFQIELPEPVTLWEFHLESPLGVLEAPAGFPRGYKVQTSMTGTDWGKPVSEGSGRGPSTVISIDPIQTRMIRVTLISKAPEAAPWSISRTRIFQAGQPALKATGPVHSKPFE